MKNLGLFCCLSIMCLQLNAQTQKLRQVQILEMSGSNKDIMSGINGAAVAWHPQQKKYYSAMAGNEEFPFCVFDVKGKRLSADSLNCNIDLRGLWFNAENNSIQANGFGTTGFFQYHLDGKGLPQLLSTHATGMKQPNIQAVGNYDVAKARIIFLDLDQVTYYDQEGNLQEEALTIHWGRTKSDPPLESLVAQTPQEYNITTVIYTGINGAELGFLNADKKQIELYNQKDGFLSKVLKLPEDTPVKLNFNFSFANNIYWLFDTEKRQWYGYR
jgi:hypothetical protein